MKIKFRTHPPHCCSHQIVFLFQHGGAYVKRSAKFNEKAMKKKLLTQTQSGAPVSTLNKSSRLFITCTITL